MSNWVKWLVVGIISILFGIFVLGNTVAASIAVTTLTGLLFLIAGVIQIFAGVSETSTGRKVLSILLGILVGLIGFSFMANPLQGMISLTTLVVILLIASGVLRLVFAWQMRQTQFFWPMLISGALSVLLAGYILANFAAASVNLLGILLGVELLFNGAGLVVLALFLRTHRRQG
jgi:uncharacterized membrane protein HdeD (DUF308 family)